MEDRKKYIYMENVLNKINEKYISLNYSDKKQSNAILNALLLIIIEKMRTKDQLFKSMYQRCFYGGSYYDGLKVNKPDEYDLDILLVFPKLLEAAVENTSRPGFVHLYAQEFEKFRKSEELSKYPKLENMMLDGKYFSTKKVRSWIEGLTTKVLNEFQNKIEVNVNGQTLKIDIKCSKSGPAFTLYVRTNIGNREVQMDIDLVACVLLTADKWPRGYKENPVTNKDTFFVVPKKPTDDNTESDKCWRLSFQEQERVLISGKEKKALKPALKLLKQLRNQQKHKGIASYFIKTIFLWEVTQQAQDLWSCPLSYVFMKMLNVYANYLKKGRIAYFWNPQHNLIGSFKQVTYTDFYNAVKNMIDEIDRNPTDPFVVAKYLLQQDDVEKLTKEVPLGKKILKNQQIQKLVKQIKIDPNNHEHVSIIINDETFKLQVKQFVEKFLNENKDQTNTNNVSEARKLLHFCHSTKTNDVSKDTNDKDDTYAQLIDFSDVEESSNTPDEYTTDGSDTVERNGRPFAVFNVKSESASRSQSILDDFCDTHENEDKNEGLIEEISDLKQLVTTMDDRVKSLEKQVFLCCQKIDCLTDSVMKVLETKTSDNKKNNTKHNSTRLLGPVMNENKTEVKKVMESNSLDYLDAFDILSKDIQL